MFVSKLSILRVVGKSSLFNHLFILQILDKVKHVALANHIFDFAVSGVDKVSGRVFVRVNGIAFNKENPARLVNANGGKAVHV